MDIIDSSIITSEPKLNKRLINWFNKLQQLHHNLWPQCQCIYKGKQQEYTTDLTLNELNLEAWSQE
jgi:hypothetical protein